jgi:hypothetical protein
VQAKEGGMSRWLAACWFGVLGICGSLQSQAQVQGSDEQYLHWFLRHHLLPAQSQDHGAAMTAKSRDDLARAALAQPAERGAALMFFRIPQTPAQLQALFDDAPLVVYELGVTFPTEGGRTARKFYERAHARQSGSLSARIAGAAGQTLYPNQPVQVFELGVIAELRTLQRAAARGEVNTLLFNDDPTFLAQADQRRACYARYGVPDDGPDVKVGNLRPRQRSVPPTWVNPHPCDRIAGHEPAENAEAARQALQGHLRAPDSKAIDAHITRSLRDLEAGAVRAPSEQRVANILLKRGLTGAGAQALLEPRRLELVAFEAKVPLPTAENHFMTFMIGTAGLAASSGIAAKIDGALDKERREFLERARAVGDVGNAQAAAEYHAVATSAELAVYRLEVLGSRESLRTLADSPVVWAVFVDEREERIDAFRRNQAISASMYRQPSDSGDDAVAGGA